MSLNIPTVRDLMNYYMPHKEIAQNTNPIPVPSPAPQPVQTPKPEPESHPTHAIFSKRTDFVGTVVRYDFGGQYWDKDRIWRVTINPDGGIIAIYVYTRNVYEFTLMTTGEYKNSHTYAGKTHQTSGDGSYSPDDIILQFSDQNDFIRLSWQDPELQMRGYGALVACDDTSSIKAISQCAHKSEAISHPPKTASPLSAPMPPMPNNSLPPIGANPFFERLFGGPR